MTDFLGNLIMRSTGEQSPLSLLQPRLPSLFEPVSSGSENPAPSTEPVLLEAEVPARGPVLAPPRQERRSTRPAVPANREERDQTLRPEPNRSLSASAALQAPSEPQTAQEEVPLIVSTIRSPGQIQPAPLPPSPEDPGWTILPRPEGRKVESALHRIDEPPASRPKKPENRQTMEPLPQKTGDADTSPTPASPEKDHVHVMVSLLQEDASLGRPAPARAEPVFLKPETNPAAVLQPVPVESPLTRVWQLEEARDPVPQQVVEIHIGRVEVRAALPSTPPKRAAQKTTMSLEDYLRKRPGERQ